MISKEENNKLSKKYGVYGEKNMYGRKFKSVFRTTYIINDSGVVEKIFENVEVIKFKNTFLYNKTQ